MKVTSNEKMAVLAEVADELEESSDSLYEILAEKDGYIFEAVKALNAAIVYLQEAIEEEKNEI